MSEIKFPLLAAALGLAIAFTLSCSDDKGGSDPNSGSVAEISSSGSEADGSSSSEDAVTSSSSYEANDSSSSEDAIISSSSSSWTLKKAKITGVFQKGPFVQGTTATLNELDNDLNPTGRPYQTLITDDKGSFELRNVELASPYAHLIASGFYRNEVTGNKSAAPIALQAVVDVTDRDNVNVNVLTHLEYYRVLDLVDEGMTVKTAKKQAQREIFAVFGIDSDAFKDSEDMSIFGASDGDAALLAISILLLGNLSEADFTQRLMNLAQAIRNGAAWSETEKAAMADWASVADLASINSNILAWGLSSAVPDFEKYVYGYWVGNYGLGECNAGLQWALKKPANDKSSYKDINYVCMNGRWQQSSYTNNARCLESKHFIDERDGQCYRYETVAYLSGTEPMEERTLTIMLDNLNYSRGNTLGYCYGVDIKNDAKPHRYESSCDDGYGRAYEWEVAMDGNSSQGLCPNGWHIPSVEEMEEGGIRQYESNYGFWWTAAGGAILAGNYDSGKYMPSSKEGWKGRDKEGFWWISNSNKHFIYVQESYKKAGFASVAQIGDLFSVYCIKN
ncbi:hypothetical protein R83H12_01051 [Fibrobacteria bacterium R8-3-H12]